jgi:hypothetical protein
VNDQFFERLAGRANELRNEGMDYFEADGIAWLEERVRQWPSGWGDDLVVLIYGDFQPPKEVLEFPSLGISIFPEKKENTEIMAASCVLEARVKVQEKSVTAILEAARRINVLLGAQTLVDWGHGRCNWWSYVTHADGGSVLGQWNHAELAKAIGGILDWPPAVRKKIEAALYWVREGGHLIALSYRSDLLRTFSAYWNAFECLVAAICLIKPQIKLSKTEKQRLIDDFIKSKKSVGLTVEDIQECYQKIVNPSFVGKARHALTICFRDGAEYYVESCFRLKNKQNRLYDIRNAIDHGEIDAENPQELVRIDSRLSELWMIVWGMFGRLIPFPAPVDPKLERDTK